MLNKYGNNNIYKIKCCWRFSAQRRLALPCCRLSDNKTCFSETSPSVQLVSLLTTNSWMKNRNWFRRQLTISLRESSSRSLLSGMKRSIFPWTSTRRPLSWDSLESMLTPSMEVAVSRDLRLHLFSKDSPLVNEQYNFLIWNRLCRLICIHQYSQHVCLDDWLVWNWGAKGEMAPWTLHLW